MDRQRMEALKDKAVSDLLSLHVSILEELRGRGVTRSANNVTGELAEYLFCRAFGWDPAHKSHKGFDARDRDGRRYEIKGRRLDGRNQSRQLSAIRSLDRFDFLASALFDDRYRVVRAALIPSAVVADRSTYVEHTNSYKFMLQDNVWNAPDVRDVTTDLKSAWDALVAEAGHAHRRQVTIVLDRDEDGIWIAECPSIPGCVSQGTTEEKAMSNILEAIQLCLEVRTERGLPLTV
jgi:predicted RNase H-like HicB family nuclease